MSQSAVDQASDDYLSKLDFIFVSAILLIIGFIVVMLLTYNGATWVSYNQKEYSFFNFGKFKCDPLEISSACLTIAAVYTILGVVPEYGRYLNIMFLSFSTCFFPSFIQILVNRKNIGDEFHNIRCKVKGTTRMGLIYGVYMHLIGWQMTVQATIILNGLDCLTDIVPECCSLRKTAGTLISPPINKLFYGGFLFYRFFYFIWKNISRADGWTALLDIDNLMLEDNDLKVTFDQEKIMKCLLWDGLHICLGLIFLAFLNACWYYVEREACRAGLKTVETMNRIRTQPGARNPNRVRTAIDGEWVSIAIQLQYYFGVFVFGLVLTFFGS